MCFSLVVHKVRDLAAPKLSEVKPEKGGGGGKVKRQLILVLSAAAIFSLPSPPSPLQVLFDNFVKTSQLRRAALSNIVSVCDM